MKQCSRLFVFLALLVIPFFSSAQNTDSLKNLINTSEIDSIKINAYFELADLYYFDKADTAAIIYTQAIELSKSSGLLRRAYHVQEALFMLYFDNSDYFNAKGVAIDALTNAKAIQDSMLISKAHSNLGNLYSYIEMKEKALNQFLEAVKIYPIEKNPLEAGKLFGRLGNLYLTMDSYEDAENSYYKAIEYFKKANIRRGIIVATQNLGIIEKHKGNYNRAIELYNQAIKEYELIGDQGGIAQCLANIGNINVENGDYKNALTNYNDALKIFISKNLTIDEILCYSEMANLYVKLKKPDLALIYVNKSYNLLNKLPENLETKLAILYRMQEVYISAGDSSSAFKYLREYQILNDSLMNLDSQRRVDILKTQFEFEQKEKDIQLLTVENKLKETELKRKGIFQIFYLVAIGLSVFAIFILINLFRIKRKANIALEHKNAEILQQKEEIESQRDEIEAQRDLVYSQKQDLESVHIKISQSIEYAQLIQESILPDPELLTGKVSDHFVTYKPKDVVSGDFYWWANVENNTVVTAADCTGHGVPGAFMSMLGISFLREIVMKEYITHPAVILRKLRKEIVKSLKQKNELGAPRDGMDLALISINHDSNVVQFAGAFNPIYIVSNNIPTADNTALKVYSVDGISLKLYEIKPDKMPIAIYYKMDTFTNHEISLQKGDQIYMFSDGFVDQFGGNDNKRFMYSAFRELLLQNAGKPMSVQKKIIESTFEQWKNKHEQIDDVLVLGIKI